MIKKYLYLKLAQQIWRERNVRGQDAALVQGAPSGNWRDSLEDQIVGRISNWLPPPAATDWTAVEECSEKHIQITPK